MKNIDIQSYETMKNIVAKAEKGCRVGKMTEEAMKDFHQTAVRVCLWLREAMYAGYFNDVTVVLYCIKHFIYAEPTGKGREEGGFITYRTTFLQAEYIVCPHNPPMVYCYFEAERDQDTPGEHFLCGTYPGRFWECYADATRAMEAMRSIPWVEEMKTIPSHLDLILPMLPEEIEEAEREAKMPYAVKDWREKTEEELFEF